MLCISVCLMEDKIHKLSDHYGFWNWENPKAKFRTGADEHNFADFHFVCVTCLSL